MVKVIGRYGFLHIPAQLFPIAGLRENAFRKAFGDEAAIGFLIHFEDNLVHICSLFHPGQRNKAAMQQMHDAQRRWVRGLFASNAFMAPEVCDTRDFDGILTTGPGLQVRNHVL